MPFSVVASARQGPGKPGRSRMTAPQTSSATPAHPFTRKVNTRGMKRFVNASLVAMDPETRERLLEDERFARAPALDEQAAPDALQAEREQLERILDLESGPSATTARSLLEADWQGAAGARRGPRRISRRGRVTGKVRAQRSHAEQASTRARHSPNTALARSELFVASLEEELERARSARQTSSSYMPSALESTQRVLKREEEGILFTLIGACTAAGVPYQAPAGSSLEDSSVALAAARGCSRAEADRMLALAQRAHALLLKFNVRLVAHVAKRYADSGVELAELVSEGLAGVEQALAKFDVSRGCKFSSLAMFYIRRECQRCVANQGRVLRLPCHVYSRLQQIMHVRTQLLEAGDAAAEHLRRNPALLHAEIGAALNLEPSVVAATLRAGVAPRELDAVTWRDSDNDDTLLDGLAEADVWDAVKETSQRQVVEASLNAVLQTLEPRERNVLRLRYGLNSERRCVARVEIAEAYGLSGERIRQIEEIAVQKLMKPWRRQFLKDFGAGLL